MFKNRFEAYTNNSKENITMTKISELFESYYQQHSENTTLDNPSVQNAQHELHSYLYEKFSENIYEEFFGFIDIFTKELEHQAYTDGFTTAIKLILETINPNI